MAVKPVTEVVKTVKEKTKLVSARILNEDGDLVMGAIQVPMSDKRPAIKGSVRQDSLVGEGNPGKGGTGAVDFGE